MRDIIEQLTTWNEIGKRIALATVVSTWGSAPRKPGAHMAVNEDGEMAGSVSGGCVEGAVVETAMSILQGNAPELLRFGVQDETAWEVGLACGGEIEIFVRIFPDDMVPLLSSAIRDDKASRMATIMKGPGVYIGKHILIIGEQIPEYTQGREKYPAEIAKALGENSINNSIEKQTIVSDGIEFEVLMQAMAPAPTLLVVGGAHIAVALTRIAKPLGYRTVVVDPRRAFASEDRFLQVDALIQKWPQDALEELAISASTAVVTLTHDPKIDDQALTAAVQSDAFFVGALGSKKTHEKRLTRLSERGIGDDLLAKIHGPVGLDIGAVNPEEIAVAIMAEIIAKRRKVEKSIHAE